MLRPFIAPATWLDVGAGHRHFCQVAREVWPDTIFDGLDQSVSIEEAQCRGGMRDGYRGEFVKLADQLVDRYDVVSMHHYLERMAQPFNELDAAAKIVRSGGYLLIEVPDPEYWLGRVLGRFWMPWFQPQHLHMMPLDNLVAALADRGFTTVAIHREQAHQIGSDLTFSLVLVLNTLVPDPRLPWLVPASSGWRRFQRRAAWAVSIPLLAGAYLLDMLLYQVARRIHRGNVYRVLARQDG